MQNDTLTILGLMTGSSADGLDLCLVKFTGSDRSPQFNILHSEAVPYPEIFRKSFRDPLDLRDEEISRLDHELGMWFAEVIDPLRLNFDLIASHGQTIKHEPPYFSLQIGEPRYMANTFNCPVVYDFRTADVESGGQGAPLIPIVDEYLLQDDSTDTLALNIGGIANLTIVPSKINSAPVLAWDTGPGNTLIDKAVRRYSQDRLAYDEDGHLAAQGQLNTTLLDKLLQHEFYELAPPRSAGQEQFGKTYFNAVMDMFYPDNDKTFKALIHTLTVLTARTIASSVKSISKEYSPQRMVVGGGGALNDTLMKMLRDELPLLSIEIMDRYGVDQDNKEAFGFAYLGYLFMRGYSGNLPSVTGASAAVKLGKICQPG